MLGEVLAAVRVAVPGTAHAGVTWTADDGTLSTWAAGDAVVESLTRVQQGLGDGPCFAATADNPVIVLDMRSDPRWPSFAMEAAERGIGSLLSLRIPVHDRPDRFPASGALILYSTESAPYTGDDGTMAEVFADRAAEIFEEAPELLERRRPQVRAEEVRS